MVLYLIGLGLCDERDITLRGLDAVRGCARVYLEAYTSILLCGKERLEALYGKEVVVADREMVENDADLILEGADEVDVAFLVVGDPFGATTHTDLQLRARERGIPVRVVHNASVMNAVGACGLQLYRFGESVSIVFFTDTWRPGERGTRDTRGRGSRDGAMSRQHDTPHNTTQHTTPHNTTQHNTHCSQQQQHTTTHNETKQNNKTPSTTASPPTAASASTPSASSTSR